MPRITKNYCCKYCGNLINRATANYGGGCCVKCARISIRKSLPKCLDCGKELSVNYAKRCWLCDKKYKSKLNRRIVNCLYCNKKLSRTIYIIKTRTNHFCNRICMGKWMKDNKRAENNPNFGNHKLSGKNNPNWKNGKSFEFYPIGFTKQLKELIRRRDNYVCQNCGTEEKNNKRKLDVHHIDYNKENLLPKNLISLCWNCHMKTNGNRDYWTKKFKNRTYIKNKSLDDILHDMKYIGEILKTTKEESNKEKYRHLDNLVVEAIDKLYIDIMSLAPKLERIKG